MKLTKRSFSRLSMVAVSFGMLLALGIPMWGQEAQQAPKPITVGGVKITGLPEDWTYHYLIFSNPGTEEDAIRNSTYVDWLKIVNDPRYIIQQLKRRSPAQGPAAEDVARIEEMARAQEATRGEELDVRHLGNPFQTVKTPKPVPPPTATIHRDWSMSLGSGATVGAGMFPAKYTWTVPSGASCNDFVVFNTGITGSASQPTIIAYSNLYSGTCTAPVPNVYWQYNTAYEANPNEATADSSAIKLSVVYSWDGTQVAFVQSTSSVASLVLLKWAGGSNKSLVQMDTSGNNVAPGSYRACSAPCMTRFTLSGSPNDTNSPPFYDYSGTDALYVGDDSGVLHKFTGVFLGTPTEAVSSSSPWPVTVSSTTNKQLTGPVYNANDSLVYVGDNNGYLHSVKSDGTDLITSVNVAKNGKPQTYSGIVAPPIVDSSAKQLYAFTARDLNGGNSSSPCYGSGYPCTGIINLPTGFSSSTGFKESVIGGYANAYPQYVGTFDEDFWSTGTGYLYTNGFDGLTSSHGGKCDVAATSPCPKLGRSPVTTSGLTATTSTCPYGPGSVTDGTLYCAYNVVDTMTGGNRASVSPVTEIYNGTTDYIFLSMSAYGALSGCTGTSTAGCVYSFDTTGGTITTTPVAGLTETGGTSGIVVDNTSSSSGASQIYFSTLANQTCAGNGTTGSGTGGCAVQVSQSSL